jgi:hypothetical protein
MPKHLYLIVVLVSITKSNENIDGFEIKLEVAALKKGFDHVLLVAGEGTIR